MNPLAMTHKRSTPLLTALLAAIWLLLASHPAYANTITITTSDDTSGDNTLCPLRAAIQAANTNQPIAGCPAGDPGPDTLHFTAPGTITLTAGQLTISESLTIDASATPITIDGNSVDRFFTIETSATVLLKGLTLTNGLAPSGEDGGAIYNSGQLTVDGCQLTNNQAGNGSAMLASGSGGGIYNSGWLTVTHSTLRHNRTGAAISDPSQSPAEALSLDDLLNLEGEENLESQPLSLDDGEGGGIYSTGELWLNQSELWLNQSQLLDNQAEAGGGALFLHSGRGRLDTLLLANNQAAGDGEALAIEETAGAEIVHNTIASATLVDHAALLINGQAAITNTIIADHAIGILSSETAQVSEDYNLFFANGSDRLNVAVGAHSLQGDPGFVDSVNGDYQLTHASLAVNRGSALAGVTQDLVGTARPQQGSVDIGAYESSYAWPQLSIGNASLNEGNEGTSLLTLPVTLSFAKPITLTVDYASSDGSATGIPATVADHDYAAISGMLTFAPMQTAQAITVAVQGDTLFENDEAFSITLGNAINATILQSTGVATIINDDAAAPLQEPEKTNTFKPRVWLPFVPR